MKRTVRYVGDTDQLEEFLNDDGNVVVLREMSELDVNVVDAELEVLSVEEARERFSKPDAEERG